jgi:hypothetical protein
MTAMALVLFSLLFSLTSCSSLSPHPFAQPSPDWESRVGQLQYRGPKMSLIGEVLVRFSKRGDFELTFTKGPGVALFVLRQDNIFAHAEGPLARGRWSGPITQAPVRLRGWLSLRDQLHSTAKSLKQQVGDETFVFQF